MKTLYDVLSGIGQQGQFSAPATGNLASGLAWLSQNGGSRAPDKVDPNIDRRRRMLDLLRLRMGGMQQPMGGMRQIGRPAPMGSMNPMQQPMNTGQIDFFKALTNAGRFRNPRTVTPYRGY